MAMAGDLSSAATPCGNPDFSGGGSGSKRRGKPRSIKPTPACIRTRTPKRKAEAALGGADHNATATLPAEEPRIARMTLIDGRGIQFESVRSVAGPRREMSL